MQTSESIDALFVRSFCEDLDDFDRDLPVIIQDFVRHEADRIPEYSQYIYGSDDFSNDGATTGIRYKFLNLLLSAARHGSDFAAQMICRIFKIYYRSEYNQLKRFKTIKYDELTGFESGEELFSTIAARILTVAPFMGIEVQDDCSFVLDEVEQDLNDPLMSFTYDLDSYSFKDGLFDQASAEAEKLIERIKQTRSKYGDPVFFDNAFEFIQEVFRYHHVPTDLDASCIEHVETHSREYAVTIALLKMAMPKKTFSDAEIQLYRAIYHILTLLVDQLVILNEDVDYMLGRTDRFEFEMERCRYKPEQEQIAHSVAAGKPQSKQMAADTIVSAVPAEPQTESLYAEIERLRASLKAKDQTIMQLNHMYQEVSERERTEKLDQEKWEDDKAELHRLREHLYQMTREDLESDTVPTDEMEKAVRNKRVVIIGGHDNWVHYLREHFPSWSYIKPGATGTIPENVVRSADCLFFFTDTISHSVYNKFIHEARKHNIPFDYLHGTNIPATIRQVYDFIEKSN